MVEGPFREAARRIAVSGKDYISMSVLSDRARSHGWWRNVVEYGPWQGPGETRVGPPTPEAVHGIAKLFGTTPERVSEMIAADWYGVEKNSEFSARVKKLAPNIDLLDEADAELVDQMIRRFLANRTTVG